jgi:hypothetical protein
VEPGAEREREETTREEVDDLNREARDLAFNDSSRSFELARRAEALARRLDHGTGLAYAQCYQAYYYFQSGRHEEALDTEGSDVLVRFADTGRGIARDRLNRIFEVGFSEKESRVRMHVGLSNVQSIVRRHGGSVEVESELGKGTAFTIRLPREQTPSHLSAS